MERQDQSGSKQRLLTIAIPTYNRAQLLDRQIEWLSQAIRGYEDDCEVLEKDGRPARVKPFVRKELLGPLERWFFGRQRP